MGQGYTDCMFLLCIVTVLFVSCASLTLGVSSGTWFYEVMCSMCADNMDTDPRLVLRAEWGNEPGDEANADRWV